MNCKRGNKYEQRCGFGLNDLNFYSCETFDFSGKKNGLITGKAITCV